MTHEIEILSHISPRNHVVVDIARILMQVKLARKYLDTLKLIRKEYERGDRYLVAYQDTKATGIVSWKIEGEIRHGVAELSHIGVLPEFQGRSTAHELFQGMIDDMSDYYRRNNGKIRKIFLKTHADNTRAHGFYKKMGMTHEATLKSHFHEGLDEYIFSLFLKS